MRRGDPTQSSTACRIESRGSRRLSFLQLDRFAMFCSRSLVYALPASIVLLALAERLPAAQDPGQPIRPNVVFMVVDDLGYGELGCYGGKEIPTPNIDRLAESGARFTSGYVTAPFCAASRAALMTGRYQTRFGFEFNPIGAQNAEPGIGLPLQEKTLADRMRDVGYATGMFGKWHLGGTAPFHPQRRGFDEFFGFLHEGHYYVAPPWPGVTTWLRRKSLPDGNQGRWTSADGRIVWSTHLGQREPDYDADNPILRGSQPVARFGNLTDTLTLEACDFIERHTTQPFFLYVPYNAVHSPMQGLDEYMARFSHIEDTHRRIFAAMLSQLDDSIGLIMGALHGWGLDGHTLVFLTSDNGGPTKELTSRNAPLRGGKGELLEGGIRVPFIVAGVGVKPNIVVETPVTTMDATATALASVGLDVARLGLDGKPLGRMLAGTERGPLHEALFWRVGKKQAIRQGDWKLIRDRSEWSLYNLAEDVSESNDLAGTEPMRVKAMAERWEAWNAEQVEALW